MDAILLWMSTVGDQALSEDFTIWFVKVIESNLDILNKMRGMGCMHIAVVMELSTVCLVINASIQLLYIWI